MRDKVDQNPNNWKYTSINMIDDYNSDYNFRIRFAPPNEGNWKCKISATVNGTVLQASEFSFTVTPSNNHGYMKVGENKRYFTLDGTTYFPAGKNIPEPQCFYGFGGSTETFGCDVVNSTSRKDNPAFFESFLQQIKEYNDAGGDYFRLVNFPESYDIEFEKLNDYYERMYGAWELDRLADQLHNDNMMMHFCMQVHTALEMPGQNNQDFDWPDGPNTPVHPSNPIKPNGLYECQSENDVGYCYSHIYGIGDPKNFFTNAIAKKRYKNRLRYITSRWGYSTHISLMELFSEINNAGQTGSVYFDPNSNGGQGGCISTLDYSPYASDPGFNETIGEWQNEMCQYLKTHQYFPHLTAVGYTGDHIDGIGNGDDSYRSKYVDVASWNFYLDGVNINKRLVHNYYKYHGQISEGYPYLSDIGKPIIISETGNGVVQDCNQGVEFYKDAWTMCFTGNATSALNWHYWYRYELVDVYAKIKQFMTGINLDGGTNGPWLPQYDERHNDKAASAYSLVSQEENKRAIGVIVNNTVNFYTMANGSPCDNILLISDDQDVQDLYKNNVFIFPNTGFNNEIKLEGGFGAFNKYIIDWYNPLTLEMVSTSTKTSTISGNLRLDHPILSGDVNYEVADVPYMVAYKIRRKDEPAFIQENDQPVEQETLAAILERFPLLEDGSQNDVSVSEERNGNKVRINSNEIAESEFLLQVTPNPTTGAIKITFTGDCSNATLKITSSDGKIIMQEQLNQNTILRDLSGQPKGVYIVSVSNGIKQVSKQIVLK